MKPPRYTITTDATHEVEELIARFERDRCEESVDLMDYLPDQADPAFAAVVTELSRIDLEHAFEAGESPRASTYIDRFPDVFDLDHFRTQLAFEEYRLRRWAGEAVERSEVAKHYDVEGSRWPNLRVGSGTPSKSASTSRQFGTNELKIPFTRYPRIGDTFAGFPLAGRLGEGAFSRVFLARQPDLASRPVVLKVTPLSADESDRLARLQHTNIIPIYSVHREGELSCICMPFLGTTTLADLSPSAERWASLDGPAQELVSTIVDRRRSTVAIATGTRDSVDAPPNRVEPIPNEQRSGEPVALAQYSQLGYVDALVSLVTRAVEGIAHAHQRGIIHRDLKPANILVGDDGNAIVLDFNLSVASHEPKTRVVGGTLPYMSPQQLAALESGEAADASDDVFSVGVILYELMSGQLPFDCPKAGEPFDLDRVIRDRRQTPRSIRSLNKGVSLGLEAIIRKCQAPNRDNRYHDAVELLEDLNRHRHHLPLRFAPNPSFTERVSKWSARHPRISSGSTVAILATTLLLLCALLIVRQAEHVARLDAESRAQTFQSEFPGVVTTLSTPGRETEILQDGLIRSSRLFEAWIDGNQWSEASAANYVDDRTRKKIRQQLGQLAYLMADAEAELGIRRASSNADRRTHQLQSLHWNKIARELDQQLSGMASQQRERISAMFEGRDVATQQANNFDLDRLDLQTMAAAESGDPSLLLSLSRQRIQRQPTNVGLWFYTAVAHARQGEWNDAIAGFNVCDSIQPRSLSTVFNRGLCNLEVGNSAAAREDFTTCLAMKPSMMSARFNRAIAEQRIGNLDDALEDLDRLVETGRATTRMVLMRSQVHKQLGIVQAARADRARALTIPPRDANDWVSRGVCQLADSPRAALDDFLAALRVDPKNFDAMLNASHVYAERIDEPEKAIAMLDRVAEAWPNRASPVTSRGIIQARLSNFDKAMEDARKGAELNPGPREQLQIAGIYALLSDDVRNSSIGSELTEERAKSEALTWLSRSLRNDPRLAKIASKDRDLANLRDNADFRRVVGSAMTLDTRAP